MSEKPSKDRLGTAEGALMGRAAHALHAESPVLDDAWALRLLDPALQSLVRDPGFVGRPMEWDGFDTAPLFALNVGALRYAEDEVERCVRLGIDQYVILGAGFDTFALRRADLTDRLRVYEVDHPDVQALKRERIARAEVEPSAWPTFVPVDFESMPLREALVATAFDPDRRAVFSWMNTLHYLTESAIVSTLGELAGLAAGGSRLVLNYACDVPLSEAQSAYQRALDERVGRSGEPMRGRFRPEVFEALLGDAGFDVCEHVTERELAARYFEGRSDGLSPSMPARLVLAQRRA